MATPANHTNKKAFRAEVFPRKHKVRQARLTRIRRAIQGIPPKPSFDSWDTEWDVGYAKGRAELAAEIRQILNNDPFEVTAGDRIRAKIRNRRALKHLQKAL